MRFWHLAAGLALAVLIACSNEPGSAGGYGCTSTSPDAVIKISDPASYSPDTITISRLQTVCWENTGGSIHSVHFSFPDTVDAILQPKGVYARTFPDTAQDFPYYCDYHATMKGLIQVR